ncbi:MAG: hypothetical protein WC780_18955 [Lentimicrobiaceae bacterium]|jgi:hypothetical protein
MEKLKTVLLTLGVALLCFSCSTTLKVVSPKANQTSSQEFALDGGHIKITVTFNKDVDPSTVVVGKTFILQTEKDPNATGSLNWPNGKTVIFLTTKTTSDLLDYNPDGSFSLKLIGSDTGNGAIKDKGGKHLDGDSDGADGGDYKTSFVNIG